MSPPFLRLIRKMAVESHALVAVGLEDEPILEKILQTLYEAQEKNYARLVLVAGKRVHLKVSRGIRTVNSDNPASLLVEMLSRGEVDAVVRGSISAAKFLAELQRVFGVRKGLRVALLRSAFDIEFFLTPVGIDEGETLAEKLELLRAGVRLHKFFKVEPKVAVLSGGRKEDLGRSEAVDRSLAEAEFLAARAQELGITMNIKHYGILLEDALKDGCTLLLAPNGMVGNMIFRTLVFLGGGGAVGAPYMGLSRVAVDVSRAMESYSDAVALASALAGTKNL